jgi:PKD repeat protein
LWDFGDGATSTNRNPSHTYAVAGTYSARLTASNASGSNSATRSVTVTAPPIPATPAGFYPLAPCRLVDTRNPNGPVGGPALAANSGRSFSATGRCGIPVNARSIAVNVTAVAPAAGGYLQAYPGNLPVPQASVLNFGVSKTRAGSAIVTLATDGTGTFLMRNGSAGLLQVVVDVNGYFR